MDPKQMMVATMKKFAEKGPACAEYARQAIARMAIGDAAVRGDVNGAASGIAELVTGGNLPTGVKALDEPLYDTEYLPASDANLELNFLTSQTYQNNATTNASLQGTQKTIAETNMEASGVVVSPNTHQAFGIVLEVLPDLVDRKLPSADDMLTMRQTLWLELYQGDRRVRQIDFAWTSGPVLQAVTNGISFANFFHSGSPDFGDYARFGDPGRPIVNKANEPFRLVVKGTPEFSLERTPLVRLALMGVTVTRVG